MNVIKILQIVIFSEFNLARLDDRNEYLRMR